MPSSSPPADPPVEPTHARLSGSGIRARLWEDVRLELVIPAGRHAEWVDLAIQTLVGPGWCLTGAETTAEGLLLTWLPPGDDRMPESAFDYWVAGQ